MRYVVIPNCSYEKYELIRDLIMETIGFAVLNDQYSKKLERATFYFWGIEYIPPELHKFILQPPVAREPWEKLREGLKAVFAEEAEETATCLVCNQEVSN